MALQFQKRSKTIWVHVRDPKKLKKGKKNSIIYYTSLLSHYAAICGHTDPYVLMLDGDMDFKPPSVTALYTMLSQNPLMAGACGQMKAAGSLVNPLYWFQKFEYSIGHWYNKAAEQMLGSVLCTPGAFCMIKLSCFVEVLDDFSALASTPVDFFCKEMGEDRYLCTLLIIMGYYLGYASEAEVSTQVPDTLLVFFKQRRRWITSTICNLGVLLMRFSDILRYNRSVMWVMAYYICASLFGALLGPAMIVLSISSGASIAFTPDFVREVADVVVTATTTQPMATTPATSNAMLVLLAETTPLTNATTPPPATPVPLTETVPTHIEDILPTPDSTTTVGYLVLSILLVFGYFVFCLVCGNRITKWSSVQDDDALSAKFARVWKERTTERQGWWANFRYSLSRRWQALPATTTVSSPADVHSLEKIEVLAKAGERAEKTEVALAHFQDVVEGYALHLSWLHPKTKWAHERVVKCMQVLGRVTTDIEVEYEVQVAENTSLKNNIEVEAQRQVARWTDLQIHIAGGLTALFILGIIPVFVLLLINVFRDVTSATSIFLFALVGTVALACLLHGAPLTLFAGGLAYLGLIVPMYALLPAFTCTNAACTTWGTRESNEADVPTLSQQRDIMRTALQDDEHMLHALTESKARWNNLNLVVVGDSPDARAQRRHLQESKNSLQFYSSLGILILNAVFVIIIFTLTLHPSISILQTTALGIAIIVVFGLLQVLLIVCMVAHWFYSGLLKRTGLAFEDNLSRSDASKFADIVRGLLLQPEPEPEPEAQPQPEAQAQAEVQAEVQADAELEAEVQADAELEAEVQAEAEPEAEQVRLIWTSTNASIDL